RKQSAQILVGHEESCSTIPLVLGILRAGRGAILRHQDEVEPVTGPTAGNQGRILDGEQRFFVIEVSFEDVGCRRKQFVVAGIDDGFCLRFGFHVVLLPHRHLRLYVPCCTLCQPPEFRGCPCQVLDGECQVVVDQAEDLRLRRFRVYNIQRVFRRGRLGRDKDIIEQTVQSEERQGSESLGLSQYPVSLRLIDSL